MQSSGMRGVYLVAAELSKRGFIVSTTSRSSFGADILVTSGECKRTFSVQVKTNARTFGFWLLNKESKMLKSSSHKYVFVNIRDKQNLIEYFVVPSEVVAKKMSQDKSKKGSVWYSFSYDDAKAFQNKWSVFGKTKNSDP